MCDRVTVCVFLCLSVCLSVCVWVYVYPRSNRKTARAINARLVRCCDVVLGMHRPGGQKVKSQGHRLTELLSLLLAWVYRSIRLFRCPRRRQGYDHERTRQVRARTACNFSTTRKIVQSYRYADLCLMPIATLILVHRLTLRYQGQCMPRVCHGLYHHRLCC